MNIVESVSIALRSLSANKLRAALTMLGIIIGVGAVIGLMSIGKGVQASVTERISGLGTNLLFVRPGAASTGGVRAAQGTAATLTLADAEAIADPSNVPTVVMVAPEFQSGGQIVANGQNAFTRILGVTPEYRTMRNFNLSDGDFITQSQVDGSSAVLVLGATVAQNLFGEDSPVGQTVRINNRQFRVIGVLEQKGGTGQGSQDDLVLAPITTVQNRLQMQRTASGSRNVNTINVEIDDQKNLTIAQDQIAALLRDRHRITSQDDFTITSQQDVLETLNQITGVMTLFLGAIAGISLLVGGIGIMNIMLVSVTERTREIGIRKAVGAKRRDIMLQFLVEATTLSLAGGAVGLALGWTIARVVSGINVNGQVIRAVVSPDIVLLAIGVSAAIGIFFGLYPSSRAASLNPIEALRYE